jgi:hypothetical protein
MGSLFVRSRGWVCVAAAALLFLFGATTSYAQFEHRGDVNLNGLPFELADAAIFAEYWAIGLPAFVVPPPEDQIAATDINMDGLTLTVADYVMMVRIILGEPDPPTDPTDTIGGWVGEEGTGATTVIGARFGAQVASLFLEYEAIGLTGVSIDIYPGADEVNVAYEYTGHRLLVLATGLQTVSPTPVPVPIFTISADPGPITLLRSTGYGYNGEGVDLTHLPATLIGDINKNQVPYDMGDAILFMNYLLYGSSAFTVDPAVQEWATDCNQDWQFGTLDDYGYFMAVVAGLIEPGTATGPGFDGYLAVFKPSDFMISSMYLNFSAGKSTGVIFTEFLAAGTIDDYNISLGPDVPPDVIPVFDKVGDTLKLAINHVWEPRCFPAGINRSVRIDYAGQMPTIISADASGCSAEKVNFSITRPGDANGDGAFNVGDPVFIIAYVFKGGFAPRAMAAADVNCDGEVNVVDALAMVNYVFKGGPQPGCNY